MSVCCECCVLSGRGLYDGLITRPEESYRLWSVVVCDQETSLMRRPWPNWGAVAQKKGFFESRVVNLYTARFKTKKFYVFFWVFRRQNLIWRRGNTQKKTYKFQNTAKIWNKKFYVIFTECVLCVCVCVRVCIVCVYLGTNSDCCAIQRYLTAFFINQNQCLLRATNWDISRIRVKFNL
jgi:hypothetical protein